MSASRLAPPGLPRDDALQRQLAQRLASWTHQQPDLSAHRSAAVALVVVDEGHGADLDGMPWLPHWSTHAALLLTRRPLTMRQHAGQWALPGGRVDEGETIEQAALRELDEEIGLRLAPTAVLGRLDAYISRSGYAITPVVVWAGAARQLQPNPDEVASVHRIGLAEFMRPDAPILEPVAGSPHPVLKMPVGGQWIAAPTAAMIYQFCEVCLRGRATRVAHFEQPQFAWR